jgi:hypothetical protein
MAEGEDESEKDWPTAAGGDMRASKNTAHNRSGVARQIRAVLSSTTIDLVPDF